MGDWFQRDHEQILRQGACNLPQLKKNRFESLAGMSVAILGLVRYLVAPVDDWVRGSEGVANLSLVLRLGRAGTL